ncbi:MAG TPA: hypothetical protein VKS21_02670 [Spirochaetota bacterium]|nr:hypothetical protein [Spirochaetota bacterium]
MLRKWTKEAIAKLADGYRNYLLSLNLNMFHPATLQGSWPALSIRWLNFYFIATVWLYLHITAGQLQRQLRGLQYVFLTGYERFIFL